MGGGGRRRRRNLIWFLSLIQFFFCWILVGFLFWKDKWIWDLFCKKKLKWNGEITRRYAVLVNYGVKHRIIFNCHLWFDFIFFCWFSLSWLNFFQRVKSSFSAFSDRPFCFFFVCLIFFFASIVSNFLFCLFNVNIILFFSFFFVKCYYYCDYYVLLMFHFPRRFPASLARDNICNLLESCSCRPPVWLSSVRPSGG